MTELTRKADYALRVMVDVATHKNGAVTSAEVARRQEVPYQFLRKIVQALVTAGLLVSQRGVGGGLSLARAPETISVLDIVRITDPIALNRCTYEPPRCVRWPRCAVHSVWVQAQLAVERILAEARLSEIVQRQLQMDGAARQRRQPKDPAARPRGQQPRA